MSGKKIILTEYQLSKVIQEEAGIAENVVQKTNEIYDKIKGLIKTNNFEKEEFKNYNYYTFPLTFDFLNHQIDCSVSCYDFFSKDYFDYANFNNDGWSVFYNKKIIMMGISFSMISGKLNEPEVKDTIQHELEHLYQQILMGKRLGNDINYAKIRTGIESKDTFIHDIAMLAYGCVKSEQEGFANGMYAYMMAQPEMASIGLLKRTPAWKQYVQMIEIFNKYSDNKDFEREIAKYGLSNFKIRKAINSFLKRIGKIYNKTYQDKIIKQGWRN